MSKLNTIFIWDSRPMFDDLQVKTLGRLKISPTREVTRYAKNVKFKGDTKTVILLTNDTAKGNIEDFIDNVPRKLTEEDKNKFSKSASSPVELSIEYS